MTSRQSLVESLERYVTVHGEESAYVPRFLHLLKQPGCFQRNHLPGHLTGSAWIVNRQRTNVLMVRHGSLRRWLQPGGHADGDENIFHTAIREAQEETGVAELELVGNSWFDIDIHPIPEKKNFPAHEHFDVRFLLVADEGSKLTISDESTDLRWIPMDALEQYNSERSVLRLRDKTISNLPAEGRTPR